MELWTALVSWNQYVTTHVNINITNQDSPLECSVQISLELHHVGMFDWPCSWSQSPALPKVGMLLHKPTFSTSNHIDRLPGEIQGPQQTKTLQSGMIIPRVYKLPSRSQGKRPYVFLLNLILYTMTQYSLLCNTCSPPHTQTLRWLDDFLFQGFSEKLPNFILPSLIIIKILSPFNFLCINKHWMLSPKFIFQDKDFFPV